MDGDQVTAPSPERVRSSSWGGPEARAELRRIADDARLRAGFVVGSIEVLRADGFLELVAFTGRPEEHASMGGSFSLALARRVLREGTGYGKFVFLRRGGHGPRPAGGDPRLRLRPGAPRDRRPAAVAVPGHADRPTSPTTRAGPAHCSTSTSRSTATARRPSG